VETETDDDKRRTLVKILKKLRLDTIEHSKPVSVERDIKESVITSTTEVMKTSAIVERMNQKFQSLKRPKMNKTSVKLPSTIIYVSKRTEAEALTDYLRASGNFFVLN
jgi:hypothetical protein